jgi:hypothetical protein
MDAQAQEHAVILYVHVIHGPKDLAAGEVLGAV